jgi:hypothetical protein
LNVSLPRPNGDIAGTVAIVNKGEVHRSLLHFVRTLPPNVILGTPTGNELPRQRNMGAAAYPGFVLYVDSDSIMPPGVLQQLLAHEQEIVGATVLERFPPWRVCALKSMDPPERWTLDTLPVTGLIKVPAVGTGCLLIRRSVFERLQMPWFRCGQIISDLMLEDTEFCLRAQKEIDVQPYLDAACRIGHATQCIIWPGRDGKPWVEWGGPNDMREHIEDVRVFDADLLWR